MISAWGLSWGASWDGAWGPLAASPPVAIVVRHGGTSGKTKRKKISLRLSDEQIRRLQDRVHVKRRALWERPKPPNKESQKSEVVASVVETPTAFIDPSIRVEKEQSGIVVALASARAEMNAIRQQRDAERKQNAINKITAIGKKADSAIRRLIKEEHRLREEADRRVLAQAQDEEDAIILLLMAA